MPLKRNFEGCLVQLLEASVLVFKNVKFLCICIFARIRVISVLIGSSCIDPISILWTALCLLVRFQQRSYVQIPANLSRRCCSSNFFQITKHNCTEREQSSSSVVHQELPAEWAIALAVKNGSWRYTELDYYTSLSVLLGSEFLSVIDFLSHFSHHWYILQHYHLFDHWLVQHYECLMPSKYSELLESGWIYCMSTPCCHFPSAAQTDTPFP